MQMELRKGSGRCTTTQEKCMSASGKVASEMEVACNYWKGNLVTLGSGWMTNGLLILGAMFIAITRRDKPSQKGKRWDCGLGHDIEAKKGRDGKGREGKGWEKEKGKGSRKEKEARETKS